MSIDAILSWIGLDQSEERFELCHFDLAVEKET